MALVRFTRRQPRIAFPGFAGPPTLPTFDDVENRMTRFFDRALSDPFSNDTFPHVIGWMPPTEIVETVEELTLTAELAGMDQKDIDISVEEGVLTLRGEKLEEKKETETDKKVYLYERNYGSFERSFALPSAVDIAKITASFDKGVLKIHLPKTTEAKAKGRKVEIKSV
ncbi:MAG TPA: Hsp20/alpha crystallin family protein [Gemmatimonadaceae bacterium]|nr:Hsp20/alpha crystallin family protein [Gemmatimonadaceae bacterium]